MHHYEDRLLRLQKAMAQQEIDGFLITQNVDLYYLSGSMQSGYLFVPREGSAVYYVRRSVLRAQEESHYNVEPLESMKSMRMQLARRFPKLFGTTAADPVTLATEFDVLPVQQFQRIEAALSGVKWVDGSLLLKELRMIKSDNEIQLIRNAADAVNQAFEAAITHIKPGLPEFELMGLIEWELRKRGHIGLMRMRSYNAELITGMVASGASAAAPTYFDGPAGGEGLTPAAPQSSSRRPIQQGEPILVDIGCCIDGYVIDQTRTVVIGELPDDLRRAYEVSESVLRAAESRLLPGTICEQLYLNAIDQVNEAGLGAHFMGFGADQVKFLGHGIGLEIDEYPVLARGFHYPLAQGMVIAVEPKFTFPGRGVVGIENSYAITSGGCEKLTLTREGLIQL